MSCTLSKPSRVFQVHRNTGDQGKEARLCLRSHTIRQALEETFVEIDFMLLSDEGYERMKAIILEHKQRVRGPGAKLDMNEEREIKTLPFEAGCTSCVCLIT